MNPYLSVIIPAHNEALRIDGCLYTLYQSYLDRYLKSYEVLVVENGSTDSTGSVLEILAGRYPYLRVIRLPQAGKGLAVRTGMLEARGEWRVMADADWSMSPQWIKSLLPDGGDQFDICITTRNGPTAQRVNERLSRHMAGVVFNSIIRGITGLPFKDTQCGYKSFHCGAAMDIFSRCTIDGWAFDVEALYIAMLRMYTIKEVAISWRASRFSHIRLVRDSLQMLRDVLEIRRRIDRSTVQPLERYA